MTDGTYFMYSTNMSVRLNFAIHLFLFELLHVAMILLFGDF